MSSAALAADASASLTNIRFKLTDLAPGDGVAASLTTVPNATKTDLFASASFDGIAQTNQTIATGVLVPGSINASGLAATAGSGAQGGSLFSSGTAGDRGTFQSQASVYSAADGLATSFMLSPHTRLTITAKMDLSISITDVCGSFQCEKAVATASIGGLFGNSGASQSTSLFLDASALDGSFRAQTLHDVMTVSFVNDGDTSLGIWGFSMFTFVNGVGAVTPVPEPATWASLLAGLAALTAVRRFRDRRASGSAGGRQR